jgi:RND family efflux transporter MFP subunit
MGPGRLFGRLVAIVITTSLFAACHHDEPPPEIPSVSVAVVRQQTLSDSITGAGTLAPATDAVQTIVAPEEARIAEIPKKEGDPVKAGDLLVRLDVAAIAQDVATAQASLAQATLEVESAQHTVDQTQALFDQGIVPRMNLDAAKAALTNAKTKRLQAQSVVDATKPVQDRLTFTSRINGVVDKRFHNEDDFVKPQTEDPILRVIDPTRVQVVMTLSIAELGRVTMGQVASLTLPDGTSMPATVTMRPLLTPPGATTADIRLALGSPTTLPLGTEVEVRIVLDERPNALVIPRSAILKDEDATYVLLAGSDHRAHRRDVKLGLQTPSLVQVVSGLAANDQVITSGLDTLGDNSPIK